MQEISHQRVTSKSCCHQVNGGDLSGQKNKHHSRPVTFFGHALMSHHWSCFDESSFATRLTWVLPQASTWPKGSTLNLNHHMTSPEKSNTCCNNVRQQHHNSRFFFFSSSSSSPRFAQGSSASHHVQKVHPYRLLWGGGSTAPSKSRKTFSKLFQSCSASDAWLCT